MEVADHIQGFNGEIVTQYDMVDALAALKGKFRGNDCHARWEGPLKRQLKFWACAAARPNYLIKVPHHNQPIRGDAFQDLGQAGRAVEGAN